MKRKLPLIIINLMIVLLFLFHVRYPIKFIDHIEDLSYDLRLNLTMPRLPDNRVVIVDIDEKSLAQVGRWPWSRDKLSLLLDQLFDRYQVAVVGFDIIFAERDESSGLKILEQLGEHALKDDPGYQELLPAFRNQLDYNRLFARKIKGRNVVLGYYFSSNSDRVTGKLPPPVFTSETLQAGNSEFLKMAGYTANLPDLQASARSGGHINPYVDPDGVCRRVPVLEEYQGAYYEAFSVAMVRSFLGSPQLTAGFPEGIGSGGSGYNMLEWLGITDFRIPVDKRVTALIPYRGEQGSFKYLPAVDILNGRIKKEELEGSIVVVGTSAAALMDVRSTPVSPVYPGVEIHANMIAGILDQTIKYKPAYVQGVEFLMLLIAGLLLTFCLPVLNPVKSSLLALLTLLAATGVNAWAWQANLVFPLASPVLLIPLLFSVSMSYGFFTETRTKQHLTGLFGQYVPRELVAEMSKNPKNFTLEGESREMTVLFSDVRSFTTISEGLHPKELTRLMHEYMTPMTHVIQKHRGTIDKYIGDAIMAFWGAPLPDDAHARNATLAALEMQSTLAELRPRFIEWGWPEIKIGVGLNTGIMRVGNMGSEFRMAYTVMGDSVNLGSRLEGITKQYGVGIVVGEKTRQAVPDIVFRELDCVQVKGKHQPVSIYEPIGLETDVSPEKIEELKIFEEVLALYRAMSWDEAETLLHKLQRNEPDLYLYQLYLERIRRLRQDPPGSGWNGVYTFTTK